MRLQKNRGVEHKIAVLKSLTEDGEIRFSRQVQIGAVELKLTARLSVYFDLALGFGAVLCGINICGAFLLSCDNAFCRD